MKAIHIAPVSHAGGALKPTKVIKLEDLRVPIHIALGRYEVATAEEINDHIADLTHELARRSA